MMKHLRDFEGYDVPEESKAKALLAFLAMGESAVNFLLERSCSPEFLPAGPYLRFENWNSSDAAVDLLGFLGYHSAVDPLLAKLPDIAAEVKRLDSMGDASRLRSLGAWSRTLGCLADRRAAEPLVRLGCALGVRAFDPPRLKTEINSADDYRRLIHHFTGIGIAMALGVVGDDRVIFVLAPMLDDGDSSIRHGAAASLVELGSAGIDALLPIACDTRRPEELREEPILALGRSNDPRVVSVLIDLMQDKTSRASAIRALRELTASAAILSAESAVANALDTLEPQVRLGLAAALAEGTDNRGFAQLTSDVSAGYDPYPQARAARALGKLGDKRSFDTLAPLLQSDEEVLREVGAEALGHLGDPSAIPALASALQDSKSDVRRAAALALAYLKDARAFEPMLVAMLPSELDFRRLAVIEAFGCLRDVRAVEPLVRCLRWASRPERHAICAALGCLGTPAIERLLVELADPRPLVRSRAALALGNIGAASAQEQLTKLLDDSATQVMSAAAEALRKLKGANPSARNAEGNTSADQAAKQGHEALADYLRI
jgi:HEAT repeat protein